MPKRLSAVILALAGALAGAVLGLSVAPSAAAPTTPVNGVCLDVHPLEGWTGVTAPVTYARSAPMMSAPITATLEHGRTFGFTQVAFDENDDPWLMTGRGNWVFAARTSVDIAAVAAY